MSERTKAVTKDPLLRLLRDIRDRIEDYTLEGNKVYTADLDQIYNVAAEAALRLFVKQQKDAGHWY